MTPRAYERKILTWKAMKAECARLHDEGKTVVFTNGTFDILHRGHTTYLAWARAQGDMLVVGLNTDDSVRRWKGDQRPIVPEEDRALLLAALEVVDRVVLFDEDTPEQLIETIEPDILVKGAQWADFLPGKEFIESRGGKVLLAPMVEGRSSTNIIERIRDAFPSE